MRKICNNCLFAGYTGGQEAYSEQHKSPLSRFSNMYCSNAATQGYKDKNESCDDFEERKELIFSGTYKSNEMRKFIFLWYDRDGKPQEYKTDAITKEIAQANFGTFQARKRLHKKWSELFEVVGRQRVKL